MIIVGTSGITSTKQSGGWHCPACGAGATYSQKSVRRYFTLFFVPIIPLNEQAKYVECHRCGGTFTPETLLWIGGAPPSLPARPPAISAYHSNGLAIPHQSTTTVNQRGNGMATASMVLGIVSLLPCLNVITIPLALIFGIIGLSKVKNGGGLTTGKGQAVSGLICATLAICIYATFLVYTYKNPPSKGLADNPAYVTANKFISKRNDRDGITIPYGGNNAKAAEIARATAELLTIAGEESYKQAKIDISKNPFRVYCELGEKSCAVLIFVPAYRKWESDSKSDLHDTTWSLVKVAAIPQNLSDDTALAVAMKGDLIYGSVSFGNFADEKPTRQNASEDEIKQFFADHAAVKEHKEADKTPEMKEDLETKGGMQDDDKTK